MKAGPQQVEGRGTRDRVCRGADIVREWEGWGTGSLPGLLPVFEVFRRVGSLGWRPLRKKVGSTERCTLQALLLVSVAATASPADTDSIPGTLCESLRCGLMRGPDSQNKQLSCSLLPQCAHDHCWTQPLWCKQSTNPCPPFLIIHIGAPGSVTQGKPWSHSQSHVQESIFQNH